MDLKNNNLSFIDNNAFIGKHTNPYAETDFGVEALLKTMKESNVSGSLIYHSASVTYDISEGNKLLVEGVKETSANLFYVWVAVPEFCYTINTAENFFSEMKKNNISAVKLFPRSHNFSLLNGGMDNLLSMFNNEKIPLLIDKEEVSWEEISYILKKYSDTPLLLQNVAYQMERFIVPLLTKYQNIYLDLSRYQVYGGIEFLCNLVGSQRLLFGSGMPLFSPEPIMKMIEKAEISIEEKQNIASKNLLRLLKNG